SGLPADQVLPAFEQAVQDSFSRPPNAVGQTNVVGAWTDPTSISRIVTSLAYVAQEDLAKSRKELRLIAWQNFRSPGIKPDLVSVQATSGNPVPDNFHVGEIKPDSPEWAVDGYRQLQSYVTILNQRWEHWQEGNEDLFPTPKPFSVNVHGTGVA